MRRVLPVVSRGFESMTRNGDGSKLYLTTEASIDSEPDKRMLDIYEFDTTTQEYTGRTFKYAKDSSDDDVHCRAPWTVA